MRQAFSLLVDFIAVTSMNLEWRRERSEYSSSLDGVTVEPAVPKIKLTTVQVPRGAKLFIIAGAHKLMRVLRRW